MIVWIGQALIIAVFVICANVLRREWQWRRAIRKAEAFQRAHREKLE